MKNLIIVIFSVLSLSCFGQTDDLDFMDQFFINGYDELLKDFQLKNDEIIVFSQIGCKEVRIAHVRNVELVEENSNLYIGFVTSHKKGVIKKCYASRERTFSYRTLIGPIINSFDSAFKIEDYLKNKLQN